MQHIARAKQAERENIVIKGVIGKSLLAASLDIIASVPIDYMHAVLEGVVKRLSNM